MASPAGAAGMFANARLMRLSPFYLDRYEVTLARWNAAVARGFKPSMVMDGCVTSPSTNASGDTPVNCYGRDVALAFCAFDGGRTLPSEAQWHHAASGRGQERTYPWGFASPTCDDAVWGLTVIGSSQLDHCLFAMGPNPPPPSPSTPPPVGSKPRDTTIDGALDMAGNLTEWTLDLFEPFGEGCWNLFPVPRDFVCTKGVAPDYYVIHGGWYLQGPELLASTSRNVSFSPYAQIGFGFRCARPASP